ncbi:unnamed protein product [Bursaphelenchus xylophilus]|uniref:(pine wood nematode) hypothetical protein n=1 Tax=Bursaphelenchus xylophilus TaxID=6326 RepID=A0A7I8X7G5_BURXY|nr:unnamed protein product [Bursaphelenchus xylophilus]CAG9126125.1 unnamed protein product [Bursaphelenchus xylophilus]
MIACPIVDRAGHASRGLKTRWRALYCLKPGSSVSQGPRGSATFHQLNCSLNFNLVFGLGTVYSSSHSEGSVTNGGLRPPKLPKKVTLARPSASPCRILGNFGVSLNFSLAFGLGTVYSSSQLQHSKGSVTNGGLRPPKLPKKAPLARPSASPSRILGKFGVAHTDCIQNLILRRLGPKSCR